MEYDLSKSEKNQGKNTEKHFPEQDCFGEI